MVTLKRRGQREKSVLMRESIIMSTADSDTERREREEEEVEKEEERADCWKHEQKQRSIEFELVVSRTSGVLVG